MKGIVQPGGIARRGWLRAFVGGLACGLISAGAGKAVRADPPAVAVNIDNFAFSPATITIKSGTVVTWTNRDDIPHVVLVTALKLRSKVMDTDQSFSQRFDGVGSFDYYCALHSHMKGSVIVTK